MPIRVACPFAALITSAAPETKALEVERRRLAEHFGEPTDQVMPLR